MNKMIAIGCFGILCTLAASTAIAQSSRSAVNDITRQGVVMLGYSPDALPFSVAVGKTTPEGYSIDWCLRVVEHMKVVTKRPDLRVRYIEVPPDQMLRIVGSGGVHLMCAAVSATAERRKTLRFSEPIFFTSVRFMVRTDEGVTAAAQLAGKSVAVIGRTTAEQAVQSYSESQNLKINLSRALTPEAAMGQLALKHAQAVARDDVLLLGMRARQAKPGDYLLLPEKLGSDPVAIALPDDVELQKLVDQTMTLAVRSGDADQLYEKWFVKPNTLSQTGLGLTRPEALTKAWQVFR
jgi:glutamate/aspartate transport system substrate-binding protein